MIKVIYGSKGTGKTKQIIEAANAAVATAKGHLIFITDNKRCMYDLEREIRFIDVKDFDIAGEAALCEALQKEFDLTTILINRNTARTNVILGPKTRTVCGPGCIGDTLAGVPITMGVHEFYQVNTPAAEALYAKAREFAGLRPGDFLLDLYCGAGTIGLCAAGAGVRLFGTEIVPEAVENARENALLNGRTEDDTRFFCGDAAEGIEACKAAFGRVDTIFVDPPRKGLSPGVIAALTGSGAERVVYISCNPATLARDLALLEKEGYRAVRCRAFDLFPRTGHVETVVLMSRVKD